MSKVRNTLAIRYTEAGADLLLDFVNTRSEREAFDRFNERWYEKTSHVWVGEIENFVATQQRVREIWEGKKHGDEASIIKWALVRRPEYEDSSWYSFIEVGWEEGTLKVRPRDLNDFIWLLLLQYSSQLAICANREGGCVTPYFIRKRPGYKYCSDVCAKPAQQAFKRQWWNEHGEEWRQERLRKKRRRKQKSANG